MSYIFDPYIFDDNIFDVAEAPPSPPPSPPPTPPSLGIRYPPKRIRLEEFRERLYFEAHIIKHFVNKGVSTIHIIKKFIEKAGFGWQIVKPIRETIMVEALAMTDELAKSLCEMYEKVEKALKENS